MDKEIDPKFRIFVKNIIDAEYITKSLNEFALYYDEYDGKLTVNLYVEFITRHTITKYKKSYSKDYDSMVCQIDIYGYIREQIIIALEFLTKNKVI
jgi:hypothetical protein